jgi:hypothetical protein
MNVQEVAALLICFFIMLALIKLKQIIQRSVNRKEGRE